MHTPPSFDPTEIEEDLPGPEFAPSEGLIQPRKLSKQYRRRVERAWQSTFAGAQTSEHTLNTGAPSSDTTSDCPTIHIATRKIARPSTAAKGPDDGDYELQSVIGEGSMGQVWSAKQNSLDRNVAVKVPRAELAGAGSVGESQFISEVVVTGQLEHPNIVPIYELGRDPTGLPFYSMKHVQGQAWNEIIENKTEQENLEVLMKVCDAVAFAHDRNFLHRDIKPHNVMVGEFGEVSLMDWGIAVAVERDPSKPWASIATGPAGTPAYMAPEMAAHNPSELGVVSDVYLLGAVLYEIATGTPPHPRTEDTREALLAAAANEIVPTSKSGELIDIARRAMATNLSDRYQSVPELQDAIREYRSHRESIKLSESADIHYRDAVANQSSDQFARAKFAYEEALRLWDENLPAKHGLRVTVLAHAKNALDQENYELGISILDASNPNHRDLLKQLEVRRASSRRLATVSKIAGGTAAAAILLVVAITFFSYQQLKDSAVQLEAEKETAVEQRKIAVTSAREAKLAESVARDAEKKAKLAEKVALAAKKAARGSEVSARTEKRRAEEAAYASEIGLAAESIRRNDFDKASKILQRMDPAARDYSIVMSKQRHLEWGLLRDAARPSTMHSLLADARIQSIDSSEDGAVVAAGTDNGVIHVWQDRQALDDRPATWTIEFGTKVSAVAVSRGGRFLAVGGIRADASSKANGRDEDAFAIGVWEIGGDDRRLPAVVLRGHTAPVLSVDFSSDATRLISSASDRTAVVWELAKGQPISVMRDHLERQVWDARFSPSEELVVTSCDDGRVRVWEIGDGNEAKKIRDFRGHNGPVYCAAFTLDGKSVISGGFDRRLIRWPLEAQSSTSKENLGLQARLSGDLSGEATNHLLGSEEEQHQASIRDISVQRVEGRELVLSGSNDNTIRVWEAGADVWELRKVLRGHGRWVRSCVFTDSGQSVLSAAFDGIKRWDWTDYQMPRVLYPIAERRLGKRPSELGLSAAVRSVHSSDGRWVATAYENGTVAVWDIESKDQTAGQLLGQGHSLLTATGRFFGDGTRLLTSAGDNTTRIWDVQRGVQLVKLDGTGYRGAASVAWRPQSDCALVVTGSDDPMAPAQLWWVGADSSVTRVGLLGQVVKERLDRDMNASGQTEALPAAASLSDRAFDRFRKLRRQIPDVTAVEFSRDGHRFAVGDAGGRCFVFEIESNDDQPRRLTTLEADVESISNLVWLNEDHLATASDDGQVRLWDVSRTALISELPWAGPVTALTATEDGQILIVGRSPVEGRRYACAEAFSVSETGRLTSFAELPPIGIEGTEGPNRPSIQSIEVVAGTRRALVTAYFPGRNSVSGYRMAWWDFEEQKSDLAWVRSSESGEIACATLGVDATEGQLLTVGGKGARLWQANRNEDFTRLVRSFRPPSSVTCLDFSYSRTSGVAKRLAFGDKSGNIRICQLNGSTWGESGLGAEAIAGQHSSALVSLAFRPGDPEALLSVDQSGAWRLWKHDSDASLWNVSDSYDPDATNSTCHVAFFSPDGKQIFVGGDSGIRSWALNDAGRFDAQEAVWKAGEVRAATMSQDGRLIVTSDGNRNVSFWNPKGERVAKMDEDDAMSVQTLALSRDRRRLVTGQGKRVVVWDTSRLSGQDGVRKRVDAANNGYLVSELLSLEQHRAVTSVAISPDGQNLLSAGTEGQTVIWSGKPIAPISITPSTSQIAYQVGANAVALDPNLTISDPCHLTVLSEAELTVSFETPLTQQRVSVRTDEGDESQVREVLRNGERWIVYTAFPGAEPVEIATILSTSGAGELRLRLARAADAESLQCLIRSLAYQIVADDPLTERVSLSPGGGDVGSQRACLRIDGLRYRGRTPRENKDLYPESLETVIEIEVEAADSERADAQDGDREQNMATGKEPLHPFATQSRSNAA
ncbi:MAG: protein kinase [Planctomycetota bacterium]